MRKSLSYVFVLLTVLSLILSACGSKATPTQAPANEPATQAPVATEAPATEASVATEPPAEPFVFGMLLVGAKNDQGWSQAHYDAGLYIEKISPIRRCSISKAFILAPRPTRDRLLPNWLSSWFPRAPSWSSSTRMI